MFKKALITIQLFLMPLGWCSDLPNTQPDLTHKFNYWFKHERGKVPAIYQVPPNSAFEKYLRLRGTITPSIRLINASNHPRQGVIIFDSKKRLNSIFRSKLVLMRKDQTCIASILTNISKYEVYIVKPQIPPRGTQPIPHFQLLSPTGKNYTYTNNYIGPLDMRYELSKNDYIRVYPNQENISFYCLADYFKMDNQITHIQYSEKIAFYEKGNKPNILLKLGEQTLVSNKIKIK